MSGDLRLAFVTTGLPAISTFLIRDIHTLIDSGVTVDVYVFNLETLDPDLKRRVEATGGVVGKIDFPMSGRIAGRFLASIFRHPMATARSLGISLGTLLRSPAEGLRALAVIPTSVELGERIRATGATQVHALWAGVPATVAYWMRTYYGIPYGISGHAWDLTTRTHLLGRKVGASKGMVVCSEFAREAVLGAIDPALQDRVHLVHHGLDLGKWTYTPRQPGEPDAPVTIVAMGRLTPKKGFEYLIQACQRLTERGLRYRCEIIGPDGDIGPALRDLCRELGVEESIHFVGAVTPAEVPGCMARADVLACPSIRTEWGDSDGIPNVVLEAMALGIPVVTTDAGGLTEVVRDGETGLLIDQRDPEALADALWRTVHDRDESEARARRARGVLEELFETKAVTRVFLRAIAVG